MTPSQHLKREQDRAKREALELAMAMQLRALGLDAGMVRQFQPDATRKHRADFCWPAHMLILEVDGGTWSGGAHARGSGIEKDAEKQNIAAILGFRTMRVTTTQVKSGAAARWVEKALAGQRP